MAARINSVTDHCHVILVVMVMVSMTQGYTLHNDNDSSWNTDFTNEGLTCWTCPNKTDNEACNNWAPDKECPSKHTVCKTVHRVDAESGDTLSVFKQCALPSNCNYDAIGCHATETDGVQDCISCCDFDYCNEAVPRNSSSALLMSSISNSACAVSLSTWRVLCALVGVIVFSNNCVLA